MDIFIDTNIFLRVLVKGNDDKVFNDCCRLLEKVKFKKFHGYTSSLVLAEINWTLGSYYSLPRQDAAEALQGIINLKNLGITDNFNASYAIALYKETNIKFVDCLIASIKEIRIGNIPVVSYDKDFDRIGVRRLEPCKL